MRTTNLSDIPQPVDTTMTLFLLWHSDQWLSYSAQKLVAVCQDEEELKEMATKYAKEELGFISEQDATRPEEPDWDNMTDEEIENYVEPEDNNTYLEDVISELFRNRQWLGNKDAMRYEMIESGELL